MLLGAIAVSLFGRSAADLTQLTWAAAFALFCTNAGIVGMYAIFAQVYPTHLRSSGTGFAIGVGRGGSVIGPPLAGWLMTHQYSRPTVAMVLAAGTLIAAGILSMLKLRPDQPAADHELAPQAVPRPQVAS